MFFEIIFVVVLGIGAGIITGLVPGIHVNLICIILLSMSDLFLDFVSPLALACFIIAMALTHTYLDSIPGVYLGAPNEAQALSILPGHRLLLQGVGHHAVLLMTIGSLVSMALSLVLFPIFIVTMKTMYPIVKNYIGYALLVIVSLLLLREKYKIYWSALLFFTSGLLGFVVLNLHSLSQPLFHLLSGLFGVSILLMSLFDNTNIPIQKEAPLIVEKKVLGKASVAATFVGFCAGFLPGFGSSQAAITAQQIVGDIGDKGFLILVGGINTVNMLVSVATVYTLEKARNGAIIAVNEILGSVSFGSMGVFLCVGLLVAGIGTLLAIKISKGFAFVITKVNYKMLVGSIIGFIVLLTIVFDGLLGLLVLGTATSVGLLASAKGIGKNHLMGCLLVPVILYFVF